MAKKAAAFTLEEEVINFVKSKSNSSRFINDLVKTHMQNNDDVYQKTIFDKRRIILEKMEDILKEELK